MEKNRSLAHQQKKISVLGSPEILEKCLWCVIHTRAVKAEMLNTSFPQQGLADLCIQLVVEGGKIILASRRKRSEETNTPQLAHDFWRKAGSGCFLGIVESNSLPQRLKILFSVSSCEWWWGMKWGAASGMMWFTVEAWEGVAMC